MNNPALPLEDELRWLAANGFDFVDLTLEPPHAWPVDPPEVRRLLDALGLAVVGHTAFYLPIASPFPELRAASYELLQQAFSAFAEVGAAVVNVHPDPVTRLVPLDEVYARNADAVAELAGRADAAGVRLMVENLGRSFARVGDLRPLLDSAPSVGFHLDVGHAHLLRARDEPNRTAELLGAFSDRLAHVHVSDNLGVDDLHLPLGAGTIQWPAIVAELRRTGWDGTVTVEVFSPERRHLETSARLWREWWDAAA
jgi:sugar phosphate isomerase/epimerase